MTKRTAAIRASAYLIDEQEENVRRILVGVVTLFIVFPAFAVRIADTTVIIPIIGRFAGVPPSVWRTDLFIMNYTSAAQTVSMTLYLTGGSSLTAAVTVPAYGVASLPDIVLNTFGQTAAAGQLELTSSRLFEARARIYNKGLDIGEFGQNAPGIGLLSLRSQSCLYGLSGVDGNRVNIGVANPNSFAVKGDLRITDKNNGYLVLQEMILQPHETRQFNDIFTHWGLTPQADVKAEFRSEDDKPVYLYASQVRNDTGDAIFLFGTSLNPDDH